MSEAPSAPQATGLGERLARARERRGLGLLQAAEKLHLEPRVLEALEAEDFESLGAAVYVRGHLQRYADLVGENAAELQALYAARPHAHATPDLTQAITERNRALTPSPRFGIWQGGLLTLLLVLVALVWWAMRGAPAPTTATVALPAPDNAAVAPESAAPPTVSSTPPAAATARVPARATAAPAAAAPAAARPTVPGPRSEQAAATASAPVARAAEPSAAAPVATAPAAATSASARPRPAPTATGTEAAKLVLKFREDSWVEVYDATGAPLFHDVAAAGAVQTLSGVPPLKVVLGNAAAVAINLNGRNVTLGAALQSTPNAQFQLDRAGRVTESP